MPQFPISFETPWGHWQDELSLPEGSVGLSDLGRAAVPLVDSYVRLIASDPGVSISCAKGCGACCRQLVTISLPEALALADTVGAMEGEKRDGFLRRIGDAEERIAAEGLELDRLSDPEFSAENHYELARKYFGMGLPCPFLLDEACSIYAERPGLCRQYLVSSPAAHCSAAFDQTVRPIKPVPEISEALAGVCAQVLGTELEFDAIARSIRWAANRHEDAIRKWNAEYLGNLFLLHLEMRVCV